MDINVVKVDVINSGKFGPKKVLTVDDGTKWNVAQKKPFYNLVTGPGMYSVEVGDFNGTPYIKYLKPMQNAPKTAQGSVSGSLPKQVSGFDYKAKLEADRTRQNEIALEFYCGLAKDVMIANKKDGEDIDLQEVQDNAFALFKRHQSLLQLADAVTTGPSKPEMKPAYQKAEEELAKAKEAELEEDPPF